MRRDGKGYEEISEELFPHCENLYRDFIQNRKIEDPDEWFYSNWQGTVSEPSFEEFSEKKEFEEFQSNLQKFLLSAHRSIKGKCVNRRKNDDNRRFKITAVAAVSTFSLLVIITFAMIFTDTSLTLSLSRSGEKRDISFPGAALQRIVHNGNMNSVSIQKPENIRFSDDSTSLTETDTTISESEDDALDQNEN
ncbi:hypothetical protein CHISP_1003 [Chitinispirillum alkaliphilum]|nr:hypothetical protein CHISP_1003 [Chitinispirillum alkaliphilum]